MFENIIPIVFTELLSSPIYKYRIENYETLSSAMVMDAVFDELSEENAHQSFTGSASYIHESSSRDDYYFTSITCNFLHLAIRLQRSDIVNRLLNDFHVNPRINLEWTNSREHESYDLPHRGKEITDDSNSISSLELAKRVSNSEIIELLNTSMNRSVKHELAPTEDGYEADFESEQPQSNKPIRYKKRLILGDGNLSYSRALSKKQRTKGLDRFPEALTVTEYSDQQSLANTYNLQETETDFKNFTANTRVLQEQGAEIILGVDATKIGLDFKERKFKRIHFNFPYYNDTTSTPAQKKLKTRQLVGKFFESASKIQEPGNRIHMALVTGFSDPVWYESTTYGVGEFCEQYGYAFIKKHRFIDRENKRYPGYFHVKTASNTSVSTAENGREFIFEKKSPGTQYLNSSVNKKTAHGVTRKVLRPIDTDSDSSSYVEHSDTEQPIGKRALT